MKYFIGILIMFIITGFAFLKGLNRYERQECEIWVKQSKMFEGWYSTDWQKKQCLHYQINLK